MLSASIAYQASSNATHLLVEAIEGKEQFVSETMMLFDHPKWRAIEQSKREPSRSLLMFLISAAIFNQDQS